MYRGVVIDDEGDPLPGVSITIVGKKDWVQRPNVDGEFSIRYNQPKCVIQFSYVGMKTQQVRAIAGKRMTVQLETDAQVIGEVRCQRYLTPATSRASRRFGIRHLTVMISR